MPRPSRACGGRPRQPAARQPLAPLAEALRRHAAATGLISRCTHADNLRGYALLRGSMMMYDSCEAGSNGEIGQSPNSCRGPLMRRHDPMGCPGSANPLLPDSFGPECLCHIWLCLLPITPRTTAAAGPLPTRQRSTARQPSRITRHTRYHRPIRRRRPATAILRFASRPPTIPGRSHRAMRN